MTTTRGAGHFGPLAAFAHAFRRGGAAVLVAAPRSAVDIVRSERLGYWAFDVAREQERDAIFATMMDLTPDERAERVVGDVFARIDARAAFPGVLAACRAWQPDVVVSETCEFGGGLAAEAAGLPSAWVGITNAGKGESVMSIAIAAVDELRAEFGLAPDPDGERMRRTPYLTLFPPSLDDPPTRSARAHRFREVPSGPRRPLGHWWPGDERPLVYVSFGSVAPTMDFFPGLYRAAIDALAAMPVRVLVTVGRDRDPADLGPLPANVHVERWIPQLDVMPHAAAIVCHGGSGTVRMGLAAGVPMAVLPLFADQPWNAERVAELGAGIALDGVAGIADAVRRLLDDATYGAGAARVAAEIRALPPVDAAVGVVRGLIGEEPERRAA